MRGRAVGLSLLGLGAFLLAAALATRLFLVPALVKLPLDQTASPVATGTGVDFFDIGQQTQYRGLHAIVRQKVVGHPDADGAGDQLAVWEHGSVISGRDGKVLNAGTYEVCLDRRTAESVDCPSTAIGTDRGAKIQGLTLTFPFGTGKQSYEMFDSTADKAFPAVFKGVETRNGVEVYRFEQDVPETVLQTTEVPGAMAGAPAQASVTADVVYSNTRTMWVEPTSGVIVTAEEHPTTVFRGPDGATGAVLLSGTFAADAKTLADGVQRAKDTRSQITMVETVLPLTLAGLGVLVLVIGAVLLRRRAVGTHRAEPVEDEQAWVPQPQ
jgi:Porin PorA